MGRRRDGSRRRRTASSAGEALRKGREPGEEGNGSRTTRGCSPCEESTICSSERANRGRQRAELLAGSNGSRAAPARFRPGERRSELEETGGGGGRGEGAVGARNRGTAAGVRRRGDGGELCSSSRRRKMGRRRRTRQRGRIRPRRRRGGWGERRTRAARKPGMTGAWRRVRAAAQNREEEERRRLTSGPGVGFFFSFLFFFSGL